MQDLNEEVHVVCVPKERRNSPECLKAKMKELEKLKEFDVLYISIFLYSVLSEYSLLALLGGFTCLYIFALMSLAFRVKHDSKGVNGIDWVSYSQFIIFIPPPAGRHMSKYIALHLVFIKASL